MSLLLIASVAMWSPKYLGIEARQAYLVPQLSSYFVPINSAAERGPVGLLDSKISPPGGTECIEVENHCLKGFSCINKLIEVPFLHSEVDNYTRSWGS